MHGGSNPERMYEMESEGSRIYLDYEHNTVRNCDNNRENRI